jgi:hypothetical protein
MKDLTNSSTIKIKGGLFLFLGVLSAFLLLIGQPTLKAAALLIVTVWAFCRFYYFAFYVMEHYFDPAFRFSGLLSFVWYLFGRRR